MMSLTLTNTLINGNCLDILPTLEADSVDLVLTDLPYGTTNCKWDSVIPFEEMWDKLLRVCHKTLRFYCLVQNRLSQN